MKTQNCILLQTISKKELETLTKLTDETLDVELKPVAKFTSAELYKIHKQKRTFFTRRQLIG